MRCCCGWTGRSARGCCSCPGCGGCCCRAPAGPRTAWLVALFAVGSVVMRGAGCVVNDMWDRDLDRLVARTAGRPLASGALRMRQAAMLLVALLAAGLLVLLQLPPLCWALGVGSLGPGRPVSARQAGDLVAAADDGVHLRLRRPDGLRGRRRPDRLGLGPRSTPPPSCGIWGSTRCTRTRTGRTTRWRGCGPPPACWGSGPGRSCWPATPPRSRCWHWPAGWPGSRPGSTPPCRCRRHCCSGRWSGSTSTTRRAACACSASNREAGLAVAAAILLGRL